MNAARRRSSLSVRSLRTRQGPGNDVFTFFLPGREITEVADITRIERDDEHNLRGFQRRAIQSHVNSIVTFLDQGPVIFPNAIILALSPDVRFRQARGPSPQGLLDVANMGTLTIPIRDEGERVAWIVDGQQRSLALSKTKNNGLPVPVVGFVSDDLQLQREQFIIVNKAKPLPTRLINELLPETGILLPRDLALRKIPSELCNLLNRDRNSPLFGLIRRASDRKGTKAVVIDSALIEVFKSSLRNPLGALAPYKGTAHKPADLAAMYNSMCLYWGVVKTVFPDAWGLQPNRSRLMHSAGIRAMGTLMDRLMARADGHSKPETFLHDSLKRIAPHCCWTRGTWEGTGRRWNEVQSVPKDIRELADILIRLDHETSQVPL